MSAIKVVVPLSFRIARYRAGYGMRYSRSLTRYRPHVVPYTRLWDCMDDSPAATFVGARLGTRIGISGSVMSTRIPATMMLIAAAL